MPGARAPRYAITNARIVTAAGPAIEKGTLVMRDGVIEDVGPRGLPLRRMRVVVDGSGLVVYPGLIDMSNRRDRRRRHDPDRRRRGCGARGPERGFAGGARGSPPPDAITWADQGARGPDTPPPSGRRGVENCRDRG